MAFDSKCRYIATVSTDCTVRIWSFETCRQLYDFSAPNERPSCVCFHHKAQLLDVFACGFSSGKTRVFNVNEAKLLKEFGSPHSSTSSSNNSKFEITDLKYTNDGKRLVSADLMKYLCLYDVDRDYALVRMLPSCLSPNGSRVTLSPDLKYLAVIGSSNHLITVFEAFSLNEILRIDVTINESTDLNEPSSHSSSNNAVAVRVEYAPFDLNQLLCVTSSNKLLKFDSKTGRLLSSITNIHRSHTDSLSVSSDGKFLVTSGDNVVKIWDYEMRMDKNFQVK